MALLRRKKISRVKKVPGKRNVANVHSASLILQQPAAKLARRPKTYEELLAQLTLRIRSAQIRSALQVNSELMLLYWQMDSHFAISAT